MVRRFGMRKRGHFEALEPRQLLAGDVAASVVNGSLTLKGDIADNKILITAGTAANSFVVTGLDGTTVTLNGTTAASATVTDVRNIKVDLGDGADLVAVEGATVAGKVTIHTGAGDDRVFVGTDGGATELTGLAAGVLPADLSVTVNGAMEVKTGSDADTVVVDAATIGGHLSVNTDGDSDNVMLGVTTGITVGNTTTTGGAAGWKSSRGYGHLKARGGVDVYLGDGDDTFNMNQVTASGDVYINAGEGLNTITATTVKSDGFVVYGEDDGNNVSLTSITANYLRVNTGDGMDNVAVRDSVFHSLGIKLGDGDDTLTTSNVTARVAVMLGGDGTDTFTVETANTFTNNLIRGFEIPSDVNVNNLPGRLGHVLGLGRDCGNSDGNSGNAGGSATASILGQLIRSR